MDSWLLYLGVWRLDIIWALLLGFMVAFLLAFAVGANDSANSWGTSVGAGTVSLKTAYILGSLTETLGAVFLSKNVIRKITTGIIDINLYKSPASIVNTTVYNASMPVNYLIPETQLMVGMISTTFGSSIWQLVATWLAWPVSGTHSIVSGLLGFTFVAHGAKGINWPVFIKVVVSWVASPLLSAFLTALLYFPLNRWVLSSEDVFSSKNKMVFALLWGATTLFDVGTILTTGKLFSKATGWNNKGYFWAIATGVGAVVFILSYTLLMRILQKKATRLTKDHAGPDCEKYNPNSGYDNFSFDNGTSGSNNTRKSSDVLDEQSIIPGSNTDQNTDVKQPVSLCCLKCPLKSDAKDDTETQMLVFKPLQVLSACTGALAHGGNDVGNAIGPFCLIWLIYENPLTYSTEAPYWILVYGGVGISVGLFVFGRRVIETMGINITKMTPSRGFCVEIMAAVTVIIASILGMPVSTTHCQVGSVLASGIVAGGPRSVDFKLLLKIGASWLATVPGAMGCSALLYWILSLIVF